ncbi:hypothetical protein [Deinococcus sp.]|uniref:hypothetical protein n=1 Tax=Deinococcus sp. TaxID=47478 RepID=UPI003CC53ED3
MRIPLLLAALGAPFAVASSAPPLRVTLSGANIPGSAVVLNGKTYISSDALKAAGFTVTVKNGAANLTPVSAAGGANQLSAVEGCLNQTLFNGIWRFKVLEVTRDATDWHVRVEVRNGTAQNSLSMIGTGLPPSNNFNLQFDSGKVVASRSGSPELRDRGFIQGEAFGVTLDFDAEGVTGRPVKLVVPLDPTQTASLPVKYSVKDPTFRIDLTCRK